MDLTSAVIRDVAGRAAALPSLRHLYPIPLLDGEDELKLGDLPVLTKDDFRAALPDLLARARGQATGSVVFGSGGTTAEPKLSLMPSHLFVPDIVRHWTPLDSGDVLVNCNNGGELGSMYPFYNMLGHHSGSVVVPLGAVAHDQLDIWLDFMDQQGATAVGGTPSHLAQLLEHCEGAGRRPPFRKIVWTGEAYGERAVEVTDRVLPTAEIHGVYGSTETWVIGHNGPRCPLDTFHLLPYQHVEVEDGLVLVTNTHPDCVNPIVRYRIGDLGELVDCPCGRPGPTLRVLGRDDRQLKFRSILVVPEEIAAVARTGHGVRDVQLALFDHGSPQERMEVRLLTAPAAAADQEETARRVRADIISRLYRIGFELGAVPGAFTVRCVDRLWSNPRTAKTPLIVRDPSERAEQQ